MARKDILHDAILLQTLLSRSVVVKDSDVRDMFANKPCMGCDHLTSDWERGKAFA